MANTWFSSMGLALKRKAVSPLHGDETSGLLEGHTRLWGPFRRPDGFSHRLHLPDWKAGLGDADEAPRRSRVGVYENGVALGPRHALYDEVASLGGGRYLHYGQELFFSSSDNTDPNSNGRVYSWVLGEQTPKILAMGGCHLQAAIWALHNRGAADANLQDSGVSYSCAEHLSLARQCLGVVDYPPWLKTLTFSGKPGSEPVFQRAASGAQVLVVEISSTLNFVLDDAVLVQNDVNTIASEIIRDADPAAQPALIRWFSKGVQQCREDVRLSAAEEAIQLIQDSASDTPLLRMLLTSLRGVRRSTEEMVSNIRALQTLLDCPRLLIVSAPNVYTPDGRGISLHPHLLSDVQNLAQALNAPLIEIGELVLQKGGAFSVMPDHIHLTPEFLLFLADEILENVVRLIAEGPPSDTSLATEVNQRDRPDHRL